MSLISVFFIGIGLSMDAFAVSIAKGMTMKKHEVLRYALILAVFFGMFQALMPCLDGLLAVTFRKSSPLLIIGLPLVYWQSSASI